MAPSACHRASALSPRSHPLSRSVRNGITTSVEIGTITPLSASVLAARGHPSIHGPSTAINIVITNQAAIHVIPNTRTTR